MHMNPVATGSVAGPEDYRWSSARLVLEGKMLRQTGLDYSAVVGSLGTRARDGESGRHELPGIKRDMMALLPLLGLLSSQAGVGHSFDVDIPGRLGQSTLIRGRVESQSSRTGIALTVVTGWNQESTEVERFEWLTDRVPPKVDFLSPIRVLGSNWPMVFAKILRANWLDYKLYSVSEEGPGVAFSFSCREENAVAWVVSTDGKLKGITTVDRYARPPAKLRTRERRSTRWQLVTHYKYGCRNCTWQATSRRWVSYHFGDPIPSQGKVHPEVACLWQK